MRYDHIGRYNYLAIVFLIINRYNTRRSWLQLGLILLNVSYQVFHWDRRNHLSIENQWDCRQWRGSLTEPNIFISFSIHYCKKLGLYSEWIFHLSIITLSILQYTKVQSKHYRKTGLIYNTTSYNYKPHTYFLFGIQNDY